MEIDQVEAQKIIGLRDLILERDRNTPKVKRLKLEKKVREKYNQTSNYKKYIRSGRLDLIDSESLNNLFTPYSDLEKAYYDPYKPRKERIDDTVRTSTGPTATSESFYDDSESKPSISPPSTQKSLKQSTSQYPVTSSDQNTSFNPILDNFEHFYGKDNSSTTWSQSKQPPPPPIPQYNSFPTPPPPATRPPIPEQSSQQPPVPPPTSSSKPPLPQPSQRTVIPPPPSSSSAPTSTQTSNKPPWNQASYNFGLQNQFNNFLNQNGTLADNTNNIQRSLQLLSNPNSWALTMQLLQQQQQQLQFQQQQQQQFQLQRQQQLQQQQIQPQSFYSQQQQPPQQNFQQQQQQQQQRQQQQPQQQQQLQLQQIKLQILQQQQQQQQLQQTPQTQTQAQAQARIQALLQAQAQLEAQLNGNIQGQLQGQQQINHINQQWNQLPQQTTHIDYDGSQNQSSVPYKNNNSTTPKKKLEPY